MNQDIFDVFKKVHTDRLRLRTPLEEDLSSILAIEGDPATNEFRPAGPMKDLAEAQETLQRWRANWQNDGFGYWAVVLPATSEVIGIGGIRREHWKGQDLLNLYYRFSPKAWGHGYARELAETALRLADNHMPEMLFAARIRPENKPSIRVAKAIGLRHFPELDSAEHFVFVAGR